MQIHRSEGVILKAAPFRDYDQILTVFTLDCGVAQFLVKGASRPKRYSNVSPTPLMHAEFVYTQGRSDLWQCQEMPLINAHLKLRQSLPALEAACDMAHAILLSQMPHIAAPNLFHLFNSYLTKIPDVQDPFLLSASFQLKILRHDGLLNIDCVESQHGQRFTEEESMWITILAFCRSYSEIAHHTMPSHIRVMVDRFFKKAIEG